MITHLTRYPIKGLSGESLDSLALIANEGIAGDRAIAIAREPGLFDPDAPKTAAKFNFLMLAKDEALAALQTRYDETSGLLTIAQNSAVQLAASPHTEDGRAALAAFFKAYIGKDGLDPQIVSAPGHKFTDISVVSAEKMRAISLVNLASVRALEEATGKQIDPRRFRANICFDGVPAWDELNWEERDLEIAGVRLRATFRTKRCPATDVNPETATRDMNLPAEIRKHFGHFDMGIYAEVETSGTVTVGDKLQLA